MLYVHPLQLVSVPYFVVAGDKLVQHKNKLMRLLIYCQEMFLCMFHAISIEPGFLVAACRPVSVTCKYFIELSVLMSEFYMLIIIYIHLLVSACMCCQGSESRKRTDVS